MPLAFSFKGFGCPTSACTSQISSIGHFLSGNYSKRKYCNLFDNNFIRFYSFVSFMILFFKTFCDQNKSYNEIVDIECSIIINLTTMTRIKWRISAIVVIALTRRSLRRTGRATRATITIAATSCHNILHFCPAKFVFYVSKAHFFCFHFFEILK